MIHREGHYPGTTSANILGRPFSGRLEHEMRSIGNSWSDLGQAPTLRHRREIALVAIGVVAIASASVILSLVDVAATKPDASFVPARAIIMDTRPSTPTAGGDQATTPQSSTTLSVSEPVAEPPKPSPSEAAQKSEVSSDREWRRGDQQRRSRRVYWQRSAHTRLLSQGSISSER
jgi:hypothetical protein